MTIYFLIDAYTAAYIRMHWTSLAFEQAYTLHIVANSRFSQFGVWSYLDQVKLSLSLYKFIKMAEKKSQKPSSGFTKEEELLLNDFSRNVSTKSSALFYGNALIVSATPICKWTFMFHILSKKRRLCRHVITVIRWKQNFFQIGKFNFKFVQLWMKINWF